MELTFNQRIFHWGAVPSVEVARAFVGANNEHFLHHRRRGRSNRNCGLFGSALLNQQIDTSDLVNVLGMWFEAARFSADVQHVVALRMMKLAPGGPSR